MKISNPKETLESILKNQIVIENDETLTSVSSAFPVMASKECPFTIDHSDRDIQRLPWAIPQAVCPMCDPRCVAVVVKQPVLLRKCHSEIGVIYKLMMQDVRIGYIAK